MLDLCYECGKEASHECPIFDGATKSILLCSSCFIRTPYGIKLFKKELALQHRREGMAKTRMLKTCNNKP